MTTPNTSNQVTDDQPKPGRFSLTQVTAGLSHLIVQSHDLENGMHEFIAKMHDDGSWSTHTKDQNGSETSITHGAKKESSQAKHTDVMGHKQDRVGGGSAEAVQNGEDKQVGDSQTLSVDGPSLDNMADSKKVMSKGGDGHQVMKGDQTFTVDEGGIHYEVAKDFTIINKGNSFSVNSDNEIFLTAGDQVGIQATTALTLTCGASQIIMTPSKITIVSPEVEFIKA